MSPNDTPHHLKEWIVRNMISDELELLHSNKEKIARLVGITQSGGIVLLELSRDLDQKSRITLYLIGKLMANVAAKAERPSASNTELASALGIPMGTVGRSLMELSSDSVVQRVGRGQYSVVINRISDVMRSIAEKVVA